MSHTIVAILEQEPPRISAWQRVPDELERIILDALAKDANERFQSAATMAEELRRLKKQLDFEAELERTSQPDQASNAPTRLHISSGSGSPPAGNTIAVLPFLNLGRSEEGDYFSDGLAEELLNVFSKIRGLRVAARTSAFSFKGKQTTIAEIGRALNVASILEGSIRIAGSRIRIAVQLVSVKDGYHLWSQTYDRMMDDIFAVQDDIARSVVEELRDRLSGVKPIDADRQIVSEVAEAAKGRATNPEAQRLMLLGRYFLDRTTREDTVRAIGYFREAIDLDPGFALCWAELGRAYSIEAGKAWTPVEEGFARSREATSQALSLEPDLAEGHAQLGRIRLTHDWDFAGAESSYQRALQLAPGSPSVLDGASVLKYKLGALDEALALSRRVLAQDPLSAAFWHNLGLTCHAAGILAEAEKAFRRALEVAPQRFVSGALLSLVLLDQGRREEAAAQASREPDEFWKLWALAIVNWCSGNTAESDAMLGTLVNEHSQGSAYQLAEVFAMRGELAQAFGWLERAFGERDPGVTHTKVNPRFRPLRSDPRWPSLLRKIGFER
jgi:TolB-like protein/cytochrome c-type biogenesis protein CcmH/NrfG